MRPRIRGIERLERSVRWTLSLFHSEAVILAYHRVFELSLDPQLLCVCPAHFAEHLEYLRRHYRVMSLHNLAKALKEKQVPKRAVVITFDDGYADNLWNAKPLLEQYDMPATVFVTTGYIGQNREFWWDELERLLLLPEHIPERLALTIDGQLHEWDLSKGEKQSTVQWDVTMGSYPSPRYKVYKELHRLLRPLNDKEQQQVLDALARWAGLSKDGRPVYRALNYSELKTLSDSSLVEIGSHSITHPVLSVQPLELQKREIVKSKCFLEDILGHPVNSFSYPYGGTNEVGDYAVQLVREGGYEVACANFSTPVTRCSNPYWLPRYLVRNWDGDEFARRLRRWFSGSL